MTISRYEALIFQITQLICRAIRINTNTTDSGMKKVATKCQQVFEWVYGSDSIRQQKDEIEVSMSHLQLNNQNTQSHFDHHQSELNSHQKYGTRSKSSMDLIYFYFRQISFSYTS